MVSQGNPVGWFEIYVDDMDRARKFYEQVFQVALKPLSSPLMQMYAFPQNVSRYGASGALAKLSAMPAGGNSTVIYFSSPDCSVEESRIRAAGGSIVRFRTSIGEFGSIVLALDTEGNLFGIHSMT